MADENNSNQTSNSTAKDLAQAFSNTGLTSKSEEKSGKKSLFSRVLVVRKIKKTTRKRKNPA